MLGFLGNGALSSHVAEALTAVYHDEILNDLRRPDGAQVIASLNKEEVEKDKKAGNGRYAIPRGGLFELVTFPNYLCEWCVYTLLRSPNYTHGQVRVDVLRLRSRARLCHTHFTFTRRIAASAGTAPPRCFALETDSLAPPSLDLCPLPRRVDAASGT